MKFCFAVLCILFGAVSILNFLPLYFSSMMTSTIYKIYRVPGISISKLCKNCHNLAQNAKYPNGSKWAALSFTYPHCI